MKSSKVFFLCLIVFCTKNINSLPQEDLDQSPSTEFDSTESTQTELSSTKPSIRRLGGFSKLIKKIGKKETTNKNKLGDNTVTTVVTDKTEPNVNDDGQPGIDQGPEQDQLVTTPQTEDLAQEDSLMVNSTEQVLSNTTNKLKELRERSKGFSWRSVPIIKNILGRACFKDIGCFSATEYNDYKRRPFTLLPMGPDLIDSTFHMFSPKNEMIAQNFSYNATADEIKNSMFDPQLNTIFITHGFRSGFELWMRGLKDSLFNQTKDFNIICVNWEKGAKVPKYNLAAINTRVVGATIAFFITTLVKTFEISNDKFYLIGHSLGAHVVGYAGKRLNDPQVARITGLDPTGPGFHFENDSLRLNYRDATLVDAYHTDIGMVFSDGLGLEDKFGYYDFYPNGGLSQPGCKASKGIFDIIQAISSGEQISCSHSRAHRFATNVGLKPWSDCQPVGYECVDYETFIEGRCFDCSENKCQPMGLNPKHWLNFKPDGTTLNYKYYLNLGPTEEFCVYHYQFAFHITQDSDEATGILDFTMDIKTDNQSSKKLEFYKIMTETQIGEIHTLLMTFQFKLQEIKSTSIVWKRLNRPQDKKRVNKGKKMKFPFIEINYMSHLEQSVRDSNSFILCPKNGPDTEIRPNNVKTDFTVCKPKDMLEKAKELVPELLVPLTRRDDLFSNDYERYNPVVQKVANSNLMKTGLVGFLG